MKVIHWSGTGNTEAMANLIGKGISNQGKEAEVLSIDKVSVNDIKNEELEESEFAPFIEFLKDIGNGKKALLFGSYVWGDEEWMRNWEEQMKGYGFEIPLEPVIVNEMPEGSEEERCINFGKEIAKL
ncbi:MAG TPA: flavodoxin domain-containing protein [Romboutsia sp.]|nr:flavodoxin domain-containing protein [Romboutsia sp.]HSQ87799.1 flavodoxin domain-containing protein [Romboutsia sp.]